MNSKLATLILRVPSSLHQRLKQEARSADLSLNKHCSNILGRKGSGPLAGEFSITMAIAAGHLQDLAAQAIETLGDKVEGVVLFGSFARGRLTASSDIDLLVVLNKRVILDRDIYSYWKPGKFEGREVAPLFVQIPGEAERISGLWFEVALDGILLFDRNLQLSRFLSLARDLIADGQVKRMVTHGHPYWVYSDRPGRGYSLKGDA
jgi:predicted nucleotidyltransferase